MAKVGRPTKYDPAMCETVIASGSEGASKAQMARDLGIDRDTLNEWTKLHSEFSVAVKKAVELSLAWWEDRGREGMMMGQRFNATAFIFQVKNRFNSDYADTNTHKHEAGDSFKALWAALSGGGDVKGS